MAFTLWRWISLKKASIWVVTKGPTGCAGADVIFLPDESSKGACEHCVEVVICCILQSRTQTRLVDLITQHSTQWPQSPKLFSVQLQSCFTELCPGRLLHPSSFHQITTHVMLIILCALCLFLWSFCRIHHLQAVKKTENFGQFSNKSALKPRFKWHVLNISYMMNLCLKSSLFGPNQVSLCRRLCSSVEGQWWTVSVVLFVFLSYRTASHCALCCIQYVGRSEKSFTVQ